MHEAVHALLFHHFDAGRQHGIVGRRERQLVDDDQRQRVAAHVHPFPETLAADQHAVTGLAELVQQFRAPLVALHEQGERQVALGELVTQALGGPLDGPQRGAQQEGLAAGRFDHGQGLVQHGVRVADGIGVGQTLRHVQDALLLVVERAGPGHRQLVGQPHLVGEVAEVVLHGQRGRGEDPAARHAFALAVEDGRDRQRRLVQLQRHGVSLDPEHGFLTLVHLSLGIVLPGGQLLGQLDAAHPALFQRFGPDGLGFQHGDQAVQLVLERLQGREEVARRRDLGQRQAHDVLREGQAQVARRLFHHRHRLAPVGAIARVGQALGQHVAAQLQHLRSGEGVAEEQGGRVGQLVRLVEDDGIGRRQQLGHARVLQGHVGEEQVMVDHHHVGLLGFLASLHHEAVLVVLALGAHAVFPRGGDQVPDHGVFRHLGQLGLVAGTGHLEEAGNFAQVAHVVARGHAAILQRALEMVVAHVVGAALEQRHRHGRLQRGPHGGNVAQEQLVLQVLGAGGDDGLAAPQQGRHQVGESLARARTRFGDQGLLFGDGLGHGLGHFRLRAARTIAAHGRAQRTAGAEQAFNLGVVAARRRGDGGRCGGGRRDGGRCGARRCYVSRSGARTRCRRTRRTSGNGQCGGGGRR